jgi:hypothetical protein
LFLGNQFPAEHSLCEEVTLLPGQVMEGTAVKKWHKEKTLQQKGTYALFPRCKSDKASGLTLKKFCARGFFVTCEFCNVWPGLGLIPGSNYHYSPNSREPV